MTARRPSTLALAALLALAATSASAQLNGHGAPAAPAAAAAPATPAAPGTPSVDPETGALVETAPATHGKDAKVEHLVTEDSKVRIEETRVRGVTTKIVVHSKIPGMGSYEIQPRNPAIDPQDDKGAGMRLFSFGF